MKHVLITGLFLSFQISECKVTLFGGHELSWLEAYNKCRHQNGQLTTNTTGLSDEDKTKLQTSRAWVCKVTLLSKWMKIMGCYYIPDISASMVDVETVANCEWKCRKYSHFASNSLLNADEKICVCLTTLPNLSSETKNCKAPHRDNYMTVYTRYENAVESQHRDGNCMFNMCTPGIQLGPPTISSCNGTGQAHGVCENGQPIPYWNIDWSESLKYCIHNYGLYFIDDFSKNCGKVTSRSWTRYFRQMFTVALQSKDSIENSTLEECETLRYTSAYPVFEFQKCNKKLPHYVCEIRSTTKGTTFQIYEHQYTTRDNKSNTKFLQGNASTERTFRTRINQYPSVSTRNPLRTSPIVSTEVMNKMQSDDSENEQISLTGVIIGVVVGVILISVSICILICIYKKRNSVEKKHEQGNGLQVSSDAYNVAFEASHALDEEPSLQFNIEKPSDTFNHEYAVVQKSKPKKDMKASKTEETYNKSSDEEYDHLNEIDKRKIRLSGNTYDSNVGIRNISDPTYDTSQPRARMFDNDRDIYNNSSLTLTISSDNI